MVTLVELVVALCVSNQLFLCRKIAASFKEPVKEIGTGHIGMNYLVVLKSVKNNFAKNENGFSFLWSILKT